MAAVKLPGSKFYEEGKVAVELLHGPKDIKTIMEARDSGEGITCLIRPWQNTHYGWVPRLVGDWPFLQIQVLAVKCVSLDGTQWIIEGSIMRNLTNEAAETASEDIDRVSPNDLTCFYMGAYIIFYYDVVYSSGWIYVVETGENHERLFMLPQVPPRSVPDFLASAVRPRALLAYDPEEDGIVEVENYESHTLAKMQPPENAANIQDDDGNDGNGDADGDDVKDESDDTQPQTNSAKDSAKKNPLGIHRNQKGADTR